MNKNMIRLIKSTRLVADPRRQFGHLLHKLSDILVIAFCAIICGAETYDDLHLFGKSRKLWLSNYLDLPRGIPSADVFERVFEALDPAELAKKMRWLLRETDVAGKIIAFDGKTMRGSSNSEHRAFHTMSAFITDNQIVIGEIICDEKSNEITAIPELLDIISVKGAVVTIDAMGTQTKIAAKIQEKGADYVLALKGNQSGLHDDVRLYFETEAAKLTTRTVEKGHGRIEKREYFLETDIDWLDQKSSWAGLRAIGAVKSRVEIKGKVSEETRFFITSLTDVGKFAQAVRGHWGIENRLHWHLDVTFGEDKSRFRKNHSAAVWNVFRKLALEFLKETVGCKASIKSRRKLAGWDNEYLFSVIFGGVYIM